MSASLPARAKALRERLVALDRLGANVEETGLLDDLRSELAPPAAKLSCTLDQRAVLVDSGIEVPEPLVLRTVRKRATTLLEKFTAQQTAATLKKGAVWANLLKEIQGACADVSAAVVDSWKGYGQSVFTGEAPALIKSRIAFTPANDAGFKTYEQLYQAFQAEFTKPPADHAIIEHVRVMAARLTETANEFDYNVPAEVKRFLEAIQNKGANLDLLTEVVLTWLKTNDAFENYRIVPRSADEGR